MTHSIYTLKTLEHTENLAKSLALSLQEPQVLALYGDLGVGKTTFVRAFIQCLKGGEKIRVKSPSYALHHHYYTEPESHHLDLFRMNGIDQIEELGLLEVIQGQHGLVLIEWPEEIDPFLPKSTIRLKFEIGDHEQRILELQNLPNNFTLQDKT